MYNVHPKVPMWSSGCCDPLDKHKTWTLHQFSPHVCPQVIFSFINLLVFAWSCSLMEGGVQMAPLNLLVDPVVILILNFCNTNAWMIISVCIGWYRVFSNHLAFPPSTHWQTGLKPTTYRKVSKLSLADGFPSLRKESLWLSPTTAAQSVPSSPSRCAVTIITLLFLIALSYYFHFHFLTSQFLINAKYPQE